MIITTKSAQAGKTTINYNGYAQYKKVAKKYDVLDSYEFVTLQHELLTLKYGEDISNFLKIYGDTDDFDIYKNIKARDTQDEMYKKIKEGRDMEDAEAKKVADVVAISALKYGDLSNQASKDYVFDIDRFTSFEGDTGPYILYTIVRIKSILNKYKEQGGDLTAVKLQQPGNASEKELAMELAQFNTMIATAGEELAPHKVCAYIYDLANAFNHFYHETKILGEENEERKQGLVALLVLTRDILETCIDMLGFEAPEKM